MPYKSEVEGALKITEIKIQRENKKSQDQVQDSLIGNTIYTLKNLKVEIKYITFELIKHTIHIHNTHTQTHTSNAEF